MSYTARAEFDYKPDHEVGNGLSFSKGEIITLINWEDDDWWFGELNSRNGYFPRSFVEFIPPASNAENKVCFCKAIALFDFVGSSDKELSFLTDQILIVTEKTNEDWWFAEFENDRSKGGFFPKDYVQLNEEPPITSELKQGIKMRPPARKDIKKLEISAIQKAINQSTLPKQRNTPRQSIPSKVIPSTYIKPLPKTPRTEPIVSPKIIPRPNMKFSTGIILFDYNAITTQELNVKYGEKVVVLEDTNPEWLYVSLGHQRDGFIPRSYVEISGSSQPLETNTSSIRNSPVTPVPAKSQFFRAIPSKSNLSSSDGKNGQGEWVPIVFILQTTALYSFLPETQDNLCIQLNPGDRIGVIRHNPDWSFGQVNNGPFGYFPTRYADKL